MDSRLASSPLDSGATSALPPRAPALLPGQGQLLVGRYHLGALLGEGGMGQVWRARDVALDREVAVKLLAAPDVAEARERFLREARAAAALNHPNIVAIHDLGQESGCLFLVMELVAGGSLREHPPQSVDEAVEVGRQLCAALAHAHAQGLVHRDVKPANVLLVAGASRLTVKLADLGLATSSAASRLTVEGGIVGTVAYLAPEQAIGRVVDGRADLYSLGVLLYELVTGRLPFSGTPVALISQHLHAPVVPPRSHRPDLDPALEAVILRLLAKDPAQRFASADETAAALAGSFAARPSQVLLINLNIISPSGPIREVRFVSDGGVHDLFTIVGLEGTPPGCNISQPDFAGHLQELRFRIPTPLFGDGLIEAIEDAAILANEAATKPFGILGRANRNGNDGTVTRFGWKAQNKSLVIFSGEAYNVEQGITNELFPDERGEGGWPDPVACRRLVNAPQDSINYDLTQPQAVPDNVNSFANFMRFLAAPTPVTSYGKVTSQQIELGRSAFVKSGCDACHKPSMTTGNHLNAALSNKTVNLFSDLLVHDIGTGDGISQGLADGSQFRTAPLWGVGQRLFFLHDGSAANLVEAINAHANEAAQVIRNYQGLTPTERQNLLNFLRSL